MASKYVKTVEKNGDGKYVIPGKNLKFVIQPAGFLDRMSAEDREDYLDKEFEKAEKINKLIEDGKK